MSPTTDDKPNANELSVVRFTDLIIFGSRNPALKRWATFAQSASRTRTNYFCSKAEMVGFALKRRDIVGHYGQLIDFLGSEGGWRVTERQDVLTESTGGLTGMAASPTAANNSRTKSDRDNATGIYYVLGAITVLVDPNRFSPPNDQSSQ